MTCYICGGVDFSTRPGSVRDNNDIKVLECTACGLVTLSETDHIDKDHYVEGKMHGEEPKPISEWLKETDADDQRRFEMLRPKLAAASVLDFGCGCGGFLLKARELAKIAEGIELEKRVQEFFREKELTVWPSLEQAKVNGTKKFDLITSFHVFEHLSDPRQMLQALVELLADNGELIIEVPSSSDALLTLYECEPFSRFTYWSQHLFLFNQHTLSELVKQAGLNLRWLKQVQRYPLSNHLHWLAKGKPGGHNKWAFLDTPILNEAYAQQLGTLGKCDTLMAGIGKI